MENSSQYFLAYPVVGRSIVGDMGGSAKIGYGMGFEEKRKEQIEICVMVEGSKCRKMEIEMISVKMQQLAQVPPIAHQEKMPDLRCCTINLNLPFAVVRVKGWTSSID